MLRSIMVFFIWQSVLFQSYYHFYGFVVDMLHLRVSVAWGEAGEIDVLQHLHDAVLSLVGDLFLSQACGYRIVIEG